MVIEQKFKEGEEPDPTEFLFVSLEQKRIDQTKPYDAKTACWIPDDKECFVLGTIVGTKGDLVTCTNPDGEEKTFKKALVHQVNPPKYEKTEDMSNLTYLNEPAVLHNLRQRYYNKLIYTYSGLFCVAINPYKRYPIYTLRAMKIYLGRRRNEVPPHIFAISDGAYTEMQTNHTNQSILITGESGAGKTENTKKVIAYFAMVGASQNKPGAEKKKSLEDQIVQTNPVLEAFGNAKTTRNDNSSRFGKFIRIHFGPTGKLAGADIETYLLEKARVISQQPLERSYHIFYQIMSGAVKGLKELLFFTRDITGYSFVSQGKTTIPNVDDAAELEQTHEAFDILQFSEQERADVYRIVAGVMHLGEIKFKNKGRDEQAEADEKEEGDFVGKLLGVKGEDLYGNFTKPRIKVGAEFVTKGQSAAQCSYAVGAISKAIYDRLFKFLVKKCNHTLDTQQRREHFIGVLDIAGFEIFDFNGFEQLCINFTNEKLQQFFNHHMFVLEQEEYQREGLDWTFEDFGMDLQACIDMMEKPMGVFSILEEESMFPKASDQTFLEKLNANLMGKTPCFVKPKPPKQGQKEAHFACMHYAGTVPYNITNWLEKNKDPLNDTVVDTLKKGSNQVIGDIFSDHPGQSGAPVTDSGKGGKKGKGSGFITVSSSYREQLSNLMTTLKATHPHFIRCIIPNELKKAGVIDAHLVMHQLTCNGVLEGIRICRKGFPNRMLYPDFVFRYQILASKEMLAQKEDKKIAQACFDKIGLDADKWRVGHTKVFFRAGVLGEMEEMRDEKISAIMIQMQAKIRFFLTAKKYKALVDQRLALEVVQRTIRRYTKLKCWPWWSLWKLIKPHLKITDVQEEMKKFEERREKAEEAYKQEEKLKKEQEQKLKKLESDKASIEEELEELKSSSTDYSVRISKLTAAKQQLTMQLNELQSRLGQEEDSRQQLHNQKKKVEQELARMKADMEEKSSLLKTADSDRASKEHQIQNLKSELSHQEELITKQQKEKKTLQDQLQKSAEECQAQEDKMNHLNKIKTKLERNLDEMEDSLEREKKLRSDIEKHKNKIEGDLKLSQEALGDLERNKKELEQAIQRKDKEISSISAKIEEESLLVTKLQKQIKELQARIEDLEEELEIERNARTKAAKARADLARELEELGEKLEEAGGQTASQIELNKKREAELAKLKRELEEANLSHESSMASMRKKHNDAVSEMAEQIDTLNKMKARAEKERQSVESEMHDVTAAMDHLQNEKSIQLKMTKTLQQQIAEMQTKYDNVSRQVSDVDQEKKKLALDNDDMTRNLEEAESQISQLSKLKVSLATQLEDTKRLADEEGRERATLLGKYRNIEHDLETMREAVEEEAEGKAELQKGISKANGEAQYYRTKYESEGLARVEELEEAKKKLLARIGEAEETIESLTNKSVILEKNKARLSQELDEAANDAERLRSTLAQMEKKQIYFDKILNEWNNKVNDLTTELEASKLEARNYSTEIFRVKSLHEENVESIDTAKRENKNLSEEIKDLIDQISEGGRNIHEVEKIRNRLQIEKEELQSALEEAESALESEENKVLRVQLELTQIKQEIDRRIQEKEEEYENARRTHQRAIDSMQASLEAEMNGKAEALKMKKKLETDINELEIALDHSNKSNAEAQKSIKKYLATIKETSATLEEEQRLHEEAREEYGIAERRANALANELEESRTLLEQAERARRIGEQELMDAKEQVHDLLNNVTILNSVKKKLEGELQTLHNDLEEILNEAKNSEEKAKKAIMDASRLSDELRMEQEYAQNQEKSRRAMESQMKELQIRLEEAEEEALKGGRKTIAKLEEKMRNLEKDLESEQRRHAEAQKNLRRTDRRTKELSFQAEENKKNQEQLHELTDKLQLKIKTYKRQIEEAEEIAALNLAKFQKSQQELDDVYERTDVAEAALSKLRTGGRLMASMPRNI